MNKLEIIQKKIIGCIDIWGVKASRNPFSWVDDALLGFNYDIYYAVHMEWVDAWNKSNREKDMDVFLREWNTVENINFALKKWGYDKRTEQ